MKPEEKVEIILWDWLKTKSQYVEEVYFNRKNKLNWKKFRVEGKQKIPDFVIKTNKGFGIKYYAVEVKDNSASINVKKGNKILRYFKNYASGETQYFLEGKEIKIEGFLLATQSSPKGFLLKNENIRDHFIENTSKKIISYKYGLIPKKEGERTYDLVRTLWELYGRIRNDFEIKCSLGILISNSEDKFSPHIMITNYSKNKRRWSQRWWKI
jgi:hypothetical protein